MRRAMTWLLGVVAAAAVVHVVTVWAIPRAIMAGTMFTLSRREGRNAPAFAERADETSRWVVRPSPDLLYGACVFDVADGPLRITAEVPRDTYWSVSMFADDTDNFFVLNDRQAAGERVDLVLALRDAAVEVPAGAARVDAPSARGIILTRTLVVDEGRLDQLDATRRRFTCAPLSTGTDRDAPRAASP